MSRPRGEIKVVCQNSRCRYYLKEKGKDIIKSGKYRTGHQRYYCKVDGDGEEIARYYKSLGYLGKGEDKLFTISFLKDKKWEDAERPLIVYIKIEPRLTVRGFILRLRANL